MKNLRSDHDGHVSDPSPGDHASTGLYQLGFLTVESWAFYAVNLSFKKLTFQRYFLVPKPAGTFAGSCMSLRLKTDLS